MGSFVTRYRIEDAKGRVLTEAGHFSRETDDAAEFLTEQDAISECAYLPGATVEEFQRYSDFPGYLPLVERALVKGASL